MMNYLRRGAQWAGGVGMQSAPGFLDEGGRAASHLTRGPADRASLARGAIAKGDVGSRGGNLQSVQQRLQRRGTKRLAGAEGVRQVMGIGPLTIGGSSGTSGIQPKSSGAVGLPPPRASGGVPGSPPTA